MLSLLCDLFFDLYCFCYCVCCCCVWDWVVFDYGCVYEVVGVVDWCL